jgi:hypothetical protein
MVVRLQESMRILEVLEEASLLGEEDAAEANVHAVFREYGFGMSSLVLYALSLLPHADAEVLLTKPLCY